eukprot:16439385-Heterocapsa_arctica.AAC.2
MRIREIQAAKSSGGSWEKASVLSLLQRHPELDDPPRQRPGIVKRLVVLGSEANKALCAESPMDLHEMIPLILIWLCACPGDVGRALMCAGRRLQSRPPGLAVTS